MKRSEAIAELIRDLDLMRGVDNGYYVYPDERTIANTLLSKLESVGMVPPSYRYEDGDMGSCFRNEWEPENEEE